MMSFKNKQESKDLSIAVIGAGIFGITTALELDKNGYSVDLFESEASILQGASGANQFRSHRGYHYPRSPETIESCKQWTPVFERTYPEAVLSNGRRIYSIAKEGSLTSAEEYLKVCKKHNLTFHEIESKLLNSSLVSLALEVEENAIDIIALRNTLTQRLRNSRIRLRLGEKVNDSIAFHYFFTVVAGYAAINSFFVGREDLQQEYQYELCEKPVVKLPSEFDSTSIVVMDGPFFCLDPFGTTGLHVLGNVVEAIHATNIGRAPHVPEPYTRLLNRGIIYNPETSNFPRFISSATPFVPMLSKAEHVGSFFTVRAVLPHREATDERPTNVRLLSENIATVFSGKIGTCTAAADQVVKLISERAGFFKPEVIIDATARS